jgi:hypothetical protein
LLRPRFDLWELGDDAFAAIRRAQALRLLGTAVCLDHSKEEDARNPYCASAETKPGFERKQTRNQR